MAELPSGCPMPEGCNWRTNLTLTIEDDNGENWEVTFKGPRMGFMDNVQHNYLLLEHIFGREPGGSEPKISTLVKSLAQ